MFANESRKSESPTARDFLSVIGRNVNPGLINITLCRVSGPLQMPTADSETIKAGTSFQPSNLANRLLMIIFIIMVPL